MKDLHSIIEGILDTDFDIHDEDINKLEEFLKKWKYGNKTKMTMPFDEFCKHLSYAGAEIPGASVNDVTKSIKAGNSFICVSKGKLHKQTNWCLYWPKSKTQYNYFNTVNRAASWQRPSWARFQIILNGNAQVLPGKEILRHGIYQTIADTLNCHRHNTKNSSRYSHKSL